MMLQRPRAFLFSNSGASIAEIALLTPVMLALLVGLIDLGRYAHYRMIVTNAARAGAQYGTRNAIVALDVPGMKAAALNDGQNISGLSANPTHFCQCPNGSTAPCAPTSCSGSQILYVQVTTSAQFSTLIKYPGIPQKLTMNGVAVMRVDQ